MPDRSSRTSSTLPFEHLVVDLARNGGGFGVELDPDERVRAVADRPADAARPAPDVEHAPEPGGQPRHELRALLAEVGARFARRNAHNARVALEPMTASEQTWGDDAAAVLKTEFGDAYRDRTCLVTGADGFMGSHLTDALVALGAHVIAFVRATSSGALNNIGHLRDDLTVVFADLTDRTSVDYLVRDHLVVAPDRPYVFHLGAQAHVGESWHRPYETVMANTVGTLNLLQSIVDHRVELEKFDTAGTSEEYGNVREAVAHHHDFDESGSLILHERSPINPKSIYATAKVAADFLTMNYHDAYGVPGVVTRMFNNYGPRQNPRYVTGTIITQALTRPEVELGALEPLRDFCFCTDGVRGHLTVAAKGIAGDVYVYGQGENISMADWSDLILARRRDARVLGRRPARRDRREAPAPRRHRRDGAARRLREAPARDRLGAEGLVGGGRAAHDRVVRREPRAAGSAASTGTRAGAPRRGEPRPRHRRRGLSRLAPRRAAAERGDDVTVVAARRARPDALRRGRGGVRRRTAGARLPPRRGGRRHRRESREPRAVTGTRT